MARYVTVDGYIQALDPDDVDDNLFTSWLRQARKIELAG